MLAMDRTGANRLQQLLIGTAAFVVIVAGMRVAAPLLVLFLLAAFIAVVTLPLFAGLKRIGLPAPVALVILVLLLLLLAAGATTVLARSAADFTANLGYYQERLQERMRGLLEKAAERGLKPTDFLSEQLDGRAIWSAMGEALKGITGLLGQLFIVLLVVIFLLLEAAVLPRKLRAIPGVSEDTRQRLAHAVESVRRYMGVKALMSLLTGSLVAILLALTGTDYPILLGFTAFLLNFVPNIGSFAAAVPGILLAFVEFGSGRAAIVAAGYLVINVGVSNFLEPPTMGRSLGLSPLVVILSLLFWGWVLGPIGMVLSVPLTMTVKIFMGSLEETRGAAILLSANVPEEESGATSVETERDAS
jgi:predicted PurR-regulated permease PerM